MGGVGGGGMGSCPQSPRYTRSWVLSGGLGSGPAGGSIEVRGAFWGVAGSVVDKVNLARPWAGF